MANAGAIPPDLTASEAGKEILRKAGRTVMDNAERMRTAYNESAFSNWARNGMTPNANNPAVRSAIVDAATNGTAYRDPSLYQKVTSAWKQGKAVAAGMEGVAGKVGARLGGAAGAGMALGTGAVGVLPEWLVYSAVDGLVSSAEESDEQARAGLGEGVADGDGAMDFWNRKVLRGLQLAGNTATFDMADKLGKSVSVYDAVHQFDRDPGAPSDAVMTYRMYPMSARPADWYTQSHPEAAAAPTTSSSRPAPTTSPAAAPADSSVADAESRRFAAGRMNNDAASQRIDQYGIGNTPDISKVAGQYGVDPSKVSLRNINGTNVYKVGKNIFTDGSDPRGALPAGLAHFGVTAVDPATGKPLPPQQEAGGQTGSATAAAAPTSGAVASIGSGSDEVASYRNALQSELMKALKDPKATTSYVNQLTDALTAMDTNQVNREQNAVQMAQARASMNRQGLRDMLDGRQFMLEQDKFKYQQQKDAAEMAKSIGKDQVDQANANRNANVESAKQFDAHFMEQGKDGKWVVNEAKKADFTGRVSKSFGKSFDQMSEPERINALNMYQLRQRWLEDKGASWMGMTVNGVLGRSSGRDSENLNDFDPKKITTDGTWAYFNDDPNRRIELTSILNVDGPTTWYTPDNQTQAQFGVVPANLRRVTH